MPSERLYPFYLLRDLRLFVLDGRALWMLHSRSFTQKWSNLWRHLSPKLPMGHLGLCETRVLGFLRSEMTFSLYLSLSFRFLS